MYKSIACALVSSYAVAAEAEAFRDVTFQINFGTEGTDSGSSSEGSAATEMAQTAVEKAPCNDSTCQTGQCGWLDDSQKPCEGTAMGRSDDPPRLFSPDSYEVGPIVNFFQETAEPDDDPTNNDCELEVQTQLSLSEWACIASDTCKIDCTETIEDLTGVITAADTDLKSAQDTVLDNAVKFWEQDGAEEDIGTFINDEIEAYKVALADEDTDLGTTTIRVPIVPAICTEETKELVETIKDRMADIKDTNGLNAFIIQQGCLRQEADFEALKEELAKLISDCQADIEKIIISKFTYSGREISLEDFKTLVVDPRYAREETSPFFEEADAFVPEITLTIADAACSASTDSDQLILDITAQIDELQEVQTKKEWLQNQDFSERE